MQVLGTALFAMSSSSSQLALGLGAGLALGLSLPHVLRLLRARAGKGGGGGGTHSVRAGLDDPTSVRLEAGTLRKLVAACLVKAGAAPSHADQVAEVLAFADARGIPSHGVNRADLYAAELENGVVDGVATPVVERSEGATAVVDGKNALGAVVSHLAMDTAIAKARAHGVGFVVCRRSNHYGAAGFWANRALGEGLIGLSFTNTAPFAVPTGGSTRAVGTNPFCCFAPAAGASFQLDMASTVVPIGKIEVMHRLGKRLPHGWGVDRHGNPCDDGAEVCQHGGLYPLGGGEETAGYKGYGLGMFIEMITSVLAGATVGRDVQSWLPSRSTPMDFGHCFICVDPKKFAPGFEHRLLAYMQSMRALPGSVQVPGDPEKAFEGDAKERGVLLHHGVALVLKRLANKHGVPLPAQFDGLDVSQSRDHLYK